MNIQRRRILGISVDDITMDEALLRARQMLADARPHMICTLNPEILLMASRDTRYAALLDGSDLALPDGIGLVWVSRLIVQGLRERVAGVDFMLRTCELAAKEGRSVFLLGGRGGVAKKTAQIVQRKNPSLHIAGHSEDAGRWRDIPSLFKADIVFVALGAPGQEQWMREAMLQLPAARILMAVGGSFDMISGAMPRAPLLLRKAGLEWLWRFILEPHRRLMRVCNAVVIFPVKAVVHALTH